MLLGRLGESVCGNKQRKLLLGTLDKLILMANVIAEILQSTPEES
jgi:hypothetical protein